MWLGDRHSPACDGFLDNQGYLKLFSILLGVAGGLGGGGGVA